MASKRSYKKATPKRRSYRRVSARKHYKPALHVGALLGTGMGIGIPLAKGYKPGASAQENALNMSGSLTQAMVGYDVATGSFAVSNLKDFWIPTIGGWATTKIANVTGLNRYLPKKVKL